VNEQTDCLVGHSEGS